MLNICKHLKNRNSGIVDAWKESIFNKTKCTDIFDNASDEQIEIFFNYGTLERIRDDIALSFLADASSPKNKDVLTVVFRREQLTWYIHENSTPELGILVQYTDRGYSISFFNNVTDQNGLAYVSYQDRAKVVVCPSCGSDSGFKQNVDITSLGEGKVVLECSQCQCKEEADVKFMRVR